MPTKTQTVWKVFRAFQNNGPDYWIVSDKAFKGNVLAECPTQTKADEIATALNSYQVLRDTMTQAMNRYGDYTEVREVLCMIKEAITSMEGK